MKKFIYLTLIATIVTSNTSAFAATIPRESNPLNADEGAISITENLMGDILDEVYAGAGYGFANARANTKIRKAVIAGETNGYSYGILSAISQNAIRVVRDMYMRPDYYRQLEERLKILLADLIADVQNGKDFDTAYEEAQTRIYQSATPSYNPDVDKVGDFCYWNIPAIDSAEFTVAKKLLIQH